MSKILVTTYVNPDIDGVAGCLAYADLLRQQGKNAEAVFFGEPQPEVGYFTEKRGLALPLRSPDSMGDWERFVVVDASSLDRLPKMVDPQKVAEVIDHREAEPEKFFPQAKIQSEITGAAATLVVERFQKENREIRPLLAELLYGAIGFGTIEFTSFDSTVRDQAAADFLQQKFNLSPNLSGEISQFQITKILADLESVIINDAKKLGEDHNVMVYQFTAWGREIEERESEIRKGMEQADKRYSCEWSLLHIFNIKDKESLIFCVSQKGRQILERAFGVKFEGNWTSFKPFLMRKQIIPKVKKVLDPSAGSG